MCETIQFTVDWKIKDTNLEDIRNLLSVTFEEFAESVELVLINDKHSITITCYAPHYQMDSLVLIARKNCHSLIERGLIDLTIGYHTIYNRQQDEVQYLLLINYYVPFDRFSDPLIQSAALNLKIQKV